MKPIVNFFIVGYPKSGTTTLFNFLKEHPKVFLPEFKEPKFFATDLHQESDAFHGREAFAPIRTLEEYHSLYEGRVGSDLAIGDVSPQYIFSRESAKNIYTYNPEAKIIIVIREPISFLRSLHFEFLAQLNEEESDFLKALDLEIDRKKGMRIPSSVRFPRYLYYSEWVNYKLAIERYTSIFNTQQVKIILFDEVVEDERKVVKEILNFLNIPPEHFEIPQVVNRNPSHSLRFRRLWKFVKSPAIFQLAKRLLPNTMYGKMNDLIYSILFYEKKKLPLHENEELQLKRRYRRNVLDLEEFLNSQGLVEWKLLKIWGYDTITTELKG